jgi:hypothetical protein
MNCQYSSLSTARTLAGAGAQGKATTTIELYISSKNSKGVSTFMPIVFTNFLEGLYPFSFQK